MELPIHSAVMHYLADNFGSLTFSADAVRTFPIRDIFSLTESNHLNIPNEDLLVEFVFRYGLANRVERLDGLIRGLRCTYVTDTYLEELCGHEELPLAPDLFRTLVTGERNTRQHESGSVTFREPPRLFYDPHFSNKNIVRLLKAHLSNPDVLAATKQALQTQCVQSQPLFGMSGNRVTV
jgi:hypothetical protein